MRLRLLPLLMILTATFAPTAAASGTDLAPSDPQWVDATFDLAQPNLTHIDLTGDLLIHKYTIGGSTQTATQMSESYQGIADHGAGTGDPFLSSTENSISNALDATLRAAFPGATIAVAPS